MKSNPVYPCLWFNGTAKEAVTFYQTIFSDVTILTQNAMIVIFELNGQRIMALNGGPKYPLTEAVSLVVECETQQEIDYYWEKLTQGGQESRCGWLKDQFGLSWQIIPKQLAALMSNPETAPKVGQALMQMIKLDISIMEKAAKS
jgi:predicted 3-demethylubiquinone-9 3-methyltransferase (glyoxalase superfamily)